LYNAKPDFEHSCTLNNCTLNNYYIDSFKKGLKTLLFKQAFFLIKILSSCELNQIIHGNMIQKNYCS